MKKLCVLSMLFVFLYASESAFAIELNNSCKGNFYPREVDNIVLASFFDGDSKLIIPFTYPLQNNYFIISTRVGFENKSSGVATKEGELFFGSFREVENSIGKAGLYFKLENEKPMLLHEASLGVVFKTAYDKNFAYLNFRSDHSSKVKVLDVTEREKKISVDLMGEFNGDIAAYQQLGDTILISGWGSEYGSTWATIYDKNGVRHLSCPHN